MLQELEEVPAAKWQLVVCLHDFMVQTHEQEIYREYLGLQRPSRWSDRMIATAVARRNEMLSKMKTLMSNPAIQVTAYFFLLVPPHVSHDADKRSSCLNSQEGRDELNHICKELGLVVDDVLKAPAPLWVCRRGRMACSHQVKSD